MRRMRAHLTYANVTATVALFIALGGGAYAAITLPPNSVGTKQLRNGAVTKSKLGKNAASPTGSAGGSLGGRYPNPRLAAPEAWHEIGASGNPTFASGWANADPTSEQTAAFYKDPFGVVHMTGIVVAASGAGRTIFTLPTGYRPSLGDVFPNYTNGSTYNQLGYLSVLPTGDVAFNGTVPGSASLSSIQFRTP